MAVVITCPSGLQGRVRGMKVRVAGEWDNESDENVIESVTITYDFFELLQ